MSRAVKKQESKDVVIKEGFAADLPPILAGHHTHQVQKKVESFYGSVAEIFERWVERRKSPHTQRAYRKDVMSFVEFVGIDWPDMAHEMLRVSVAQVQGFRDQMVSDGKAGKTLNRRISSLSSFYKYLGASASLMHLPIQVPNPAHAQFIDRASADPEEETESLTLSRARKLMSLPRVDTGGKDLSPEKIRELEILVARDVAILKFYLWTGARIGTGCKLRVDDFYLDADDATIKVKEKGSKKRRIGLNFQAAEAIQSYLDVSGISGGPLFRARANPKSTKLGSRAMSERSMYRLIQSYLEQLPGAMTESGCRYSPHSLRATAATLGLDAGIPIEKIQEMLGHRHITTTQIYDKRRKRTSDGASHELPF